MTKINVSQADYFLKVIFHTTILCFLYLYSFPLNGLDPETPIQRYQLDEWCKKSQLPSNSVQNLMQTPDGFMWIDCNGAVVRFDGQKFVPFHKLDITNNQVKPRHSLSIIMVEDNGTLWLKNNCLGIMKYHQDQLTCIKPEDDFFYYIWIGLKDSYGNVWMGTGNGSLYCHRSGGFIEYGPDKGIPGHGISSIIEDRSGQLWVSTFNDGIFKSKGGSFYPVPIKGIDRNTVTNWLYEDRSGVIWMGTNKGLFWEKDGILDHLTTSDGLSHDFITDIIEDSDGNIWVGTRDGINRIRKYSSGGIRIDSCLHKHIINVIFEDQEKNLWIGTEGTGMKRLRDALFRTIDFGKAYPRDITCIHQTARGETWIGNSVGDLLRIEKEKIVEHFPIKSQINALADDTNHNLWIGTMELGLFCLTARKRIIHYEKELKSRVITTLYWDSRHRLWIGDTKGFSVYKQGKFTSFHHLEKFPSSCILFFQEDDNHNIWIGSDGLYLLEKGEINPPRLNNVFENTKMKPGVSCMFFDDDQSIWLGTPCGIIIKKSGKDFTFFCKNIHWRSNMNASIINIFKDDAGYFWMNTLDGILRINRKELEDLNRGKIQWLLPRQYGPADGLECCESLAFPYHSFIKPREGEYWFATKKGIAVLPLEKVKINKVPPQVVIEKVKVDGTDIPIDKAAYIFEHAGHLRFYFTAATLTSQEGVCFQYKLTGIDKDWIRITPGKERTAEYWNLSPGTHTFSVNACNNDGLWSHDKTEVTVTIAAAFLGTFPGKILLLAGILMMIGLVYFLHRKALQKVKAEAARAAVDIVDMGSDSRYLLKLKQLMEVKKLYRDVGLTLKTLSHHLTIPERTLSQLINEKLHKSFFDFINCYRVEEAKQMLAKNNGGKKNILDIAFEVGFNTKSAFNRAFKKHANMTPSQFRDEYVNAKNNRN